VLVRVVSCADLGLAAALMQAGLPVEVLLAPDVAPNPREGPSAPFVRMPSGVTAAELDDFALALSDVVLWDPRSGPEPELIRLGREQKKPIVQAGDELPTLPVPHPEIAGWLDTGKWQWRWFGRHVCGRTEQFWMELFAFNWRGPARGGSKYSRGRLRRCIALGWSNFQQPYFAPEDATIEGRDWRKLAPDTRSADDTALIVQRFNSLDQSALCGSLLHRDLIWIAYFASAFAVLAAVMGSLGSFRQGMTWPITELVTLSVIFLSIVLIRGVHLQDHWTSCRLAAEQLRIARLCLPLFVVPWALRAADRPSPDASEFTVRALDEVKRAVRDQGLPRPAPDLTPAKAAAWLKLIVSDQASYHDNNAGRLERAENNLRAWAFVFFLLAVTAVILHFFHEMPLLTPWLMPWLLPWLLIFTAAGPAFAAALHGVSTRLGIVHRIALSRDTRLELDAISARLADFDAARHPEQAWRELRALALKASNAMGNENASWHSLVRRERDDIT
jgi:hypothetical protein